MRRAQPRQRVAAPGSFALTFDDGPDPTFTPQVLDLLAERGAVATFFMVGSSAEAHPELVRRVVAEGHGLGSHTWSHPELLGLSFTRLLRECRRGRQTVEQAAGRPVPAYRPPKGHWDGRGAAAATALRLQPWIWTQDPRDWEGDARAEGIMGSLESLSASDVVLLHDGIQSPPDPAAHDRSATVAALGPLLDLAAERGLRPVRLEGS
ncbi:MAG TPA: polysaccharide deacetylase family protein [Solirubrobacterales bacterium]|nr:polysaccharide deacetylase family protein [Solirubrobacterales bacterium]